MNAKDIFQNKYLRAILAIVAVFLWGSAFPAVKMGMLIFGIAADQTGHKVLFAGYRFLLAGLLILLVSVILKLDLKIRSKQIKAIIILGLLNTTIQYSLFYIGLSNTTAVKGSIITATSVFNTFILAHLFLRDDRMNKKKLLGVIIGFTGVLIVNYSPAILAFDFQPAGEGLLLVSSVSAAAGTVYLKRISNSVSVVVLTAYQMIVGSLFLIIPAAATTGFWPFTVGPQNMAILAYLAFLSAIAFTLWNLLIKYNLVGQVTIYKFLIPVFGVILASILIKEQITLTTVLALGVVSTGIITVNTVDFLTRRANGI